MSSDEREPEPERVVINDKRRVSPNLDAKPAPAESAEPVGAEPSPDANAQLLAERTADLQRVQAEYANYRRRADRDRLVAGEVAVSRVLKDLLPVLDDLDRARVHGDLTGALKAVADRLDAIFAKLGLVSFGEVGDTFDPSVHEAVLHDQSDQVSEPTCTTIMRPGYKHGDRLLRPAMVGVSDPATPEEPAPADEATDEPSEDPAESAPSATEQSDDDANPHADNDASDSGGDQPGADA